MADIQFNPMDPEFVADPYPTYRRLQAEDPVHHSPLGFWVFTRYADVIAMLRDPRLIKEPIAAFVAARALSSAPPRVTVVALGVTALLWHYATLQGLVANGAVQWLPQWMGS